MMNLTIALIFAFLSTTAVHAETYNYSCNVCVFPTIAIDDGYDGCDALTERRIHFGWITTKMSSNGGERNTA